MKKLLLSIVSLIASTSAFAELSFDKAYWIIKDGKLTDNVEIYEERRLMKSLKNMKNGFLHSKM